MSKSGIKSTAIRYCKAEGCDRQAYVPGSGRGYCGKHYDKFKKYGDPLFVKKVRNRCTVDDCEKFVVGNGLCSMHYTRMQRHGSTDLPHKWANAPEGTKWCPQCRTYPLASDFSPNKRNRDGLDSWCKSCNAKKARRRRKIDPSVYLKPKVSAKCAECGEEFQADLRRTLHCSTECKRAGKKRWDVVYQRNNPERHNEANRRWRQRYPEKQLAKAHVYRARKVKATVEVVSVAAIFERDQWLCGICGERIDPKLLYPDPMSRSVDHVIPLVHGGAHSMANCQASHLVCNLRKGDTITP